MIAVVTQGQSKAEVEIGSGGGFSLTDVVCLALGYGAIELEGVTVQFPNELETVFTVFYRFGPSAGGFMASVSVTREVTR